MTWNLGAAVLAVIVIVAFVAIVIRIIDKDFKRYLPEDRE